MRRKLAHVALHVHTYTAGSNNSQCGALAGCRSGEGSQQERAGGRAGIEGGTHRGKHTSTHKQAGAAVLQACADS